MFEKSVLLGKANKATVNEVFKLPIKEQVAAYKETLRALDGFLDAGDLPRVTTASMTVIKSDLLNVMTGLRQIKDQNLQESLTYVRSVDEILTHLRPAKIIIFNTEGFFQSDKLKEESKDAFYNKMEECRGHIENAIRIFNK